ncbi:B12-binding domain-containing radical SAM protein [Geomesophilobacter sediminis]|uniref:Cobalamin-dependent protein n=1 Tax=Geomesophilobacter sediminis TaxID=2798584 RepID=A0A8J7M248_9BACT|nr:cobalamin-dependent protein [Geomesophilobacter sediminis]MBJ6727324.1 cobalamin-dependent protein [Geomesophilobacter sediminis]
MESAIDKKILFVTPPYHCGVVEVAGRWIPLNFVYLAGAVRQAGFRAEIYDAMTKHHTFSEIALRLGEAKADYVGVTAMTCTINDALQTLELAKRINPQTVTILGGVHPTFMYQELLTGSSCVDYIIVGEGEVSLPELLTVLEQKGDPASVPGVAFWNGERVVTTPKRCFLQDLDNLPAAWDLLEWNDYQYFIIPGSRLGAVSTSRGCEHACVICAQDKFWEKSWRPRDPQKVADEMEHLSRSYGVNVILITDENASRDPKRWEALLDAVIAKDLGLHLIMESRAADLVRDRDIMWKYKKAGVAHISIGIEATDQAQWEQMKSGLYVDEAKMALDLIHEHGIVSEAAFVLGFPDETFESAKYIFKLAQYYNPDNAHFMAVTPWPYSDMYQEMKPYIREWDYSKYNWIDPIIQPKTMSMLQIDVAIVDCYRKFYMEKMIDIMVMKDEFKRNYLLRAMKLIMASPFIMKKLKVGIMGKVPAKLGELKQRFT